MSNVESLLVRALYACATADLLITAARVDDFKEKHPDYADDIQKLNDEDPSSSKKYLPWAVKRLLDGDKVDELVEAINKFDQFSNKLEKKDIFQYRKLKELQDAVEEAEKAEKSDVKKQTSVFIRKNADYLYNDDEFLLVHPKVKKASCHYGMGTTWCVSQVDAEYYERYEKQNCFLYFIIDKTKEDESKKLAHESDPWAKIAFRFCKDDPEPKEIRDRRNNGLTIGQVLNHFRKRGDGTEDKVWEMIRLAYKHASRKEDTLLYRLANKVLEEGEAASLLEEYGLDPAVKMELASNKGTPAIVLDKMISPSENKSVLMNIINNENADTDLKKRLLGDQYPLEVRSVVVYKMINDGQGTEAIRLFTKPYLKLEELPYKVADIMFHKDSPPDVLVEAVRLLPNSIYKAVRHENFNQDVALAVLKSPHASQTEKTDAMKQVAFSEEQFLAVATGDDLEMKNAIASNPNLPASAAKELAKSGRMDLQIALARNTATPPSVLENLADRNLDSAYPASTSVILSIAANESTPDSVLNALTDLSLTDNPRGEDLAKRLLENKKLSDKNRERIVVEYALRAEVPWASRDGLRSAAESLKAPAINDMLGRLDLSRSSFHRDLLISLANNKNIDYEAKDKILRIIELRNDELVAKSVARVISRNLTSQEEVRRLHNAFPGTDTYIQSLIWKSGKYNENTPPDILSQLAKIEPPRGMSESFYSPIFNHRNFPIEELVKYASRPTTVAGKIAKAALRNRPDAPATVRKPRAKKPAVEQPAVEASMNALADKLHRLNAPVHILLAVEEAAAAMAGD
jgi:hypothetical protein